MRYTSKSNVRLLSLCFLISLVFGAMRAYFGQSLPVLLWQMTGNEKVCFPLQLLVRHIVQLFDCNGFSRLGKFVFMSVRMFVCVLAFFNLKNACRPHVACCVHAV